MIDAAKSWPDCTFVSSVPCRQAGRRVLTFSEVGFDVADMQIDLRYVDPSIASRVRWKHGNLCV